jgi:hypothetical protein
MTLFITTRLRALIPKAEPFPSARNEKIVLAENLYSDYYSGTPKVRLFLRLTTA